MAVSIQVTTIWLREHESSNTAIKRRNTSQNTSMAKAMEKTSSSAGKVNLQDLYYRYRGNRVPSNIVVFVSSQHIQRWRRQYDQRPERTHTHKNAKKKLNQHPLTSWKTLAIILATDQWSLSGNMHTNHWTQRTKQKEKLQVSPIHKFNAFNSERLSHEGKWCRVIGYPRKL